MSAQREFRGVPEQNRGDKRKSVKGASHTSVFIYTGQHCSSRTLTALLEISALTLCIANAHTKFFVHHHISDDGIGYVLDFSVCFGWLSIEPVFFWGQSVLRPHKDETWEKTTLYFAFLNPEP